MITGTTEGSPITSCPQALQAEKKLPLKRKLLLLWKKQEQDRQKTEEAFSLSPKAPVSLKRKREEQEDIANQAPSNKKAKTENSSLLVSETLCFPLPAASKDAAIAIGRLFVESLEHKPHWRPDLLCLNALTQNPRNRRLLRANEIDKLPKEDPYRKAISLWRRLIQDGEEVSVSKNPHKIECFAKKESYYIVKQRENAQEGHLQRTIRLYVSKEGESLRYEPLIPLHYLIQTNNEKERF